MTKNSLRRKKGENWMSGVGSLPERFARRMQARKIRRGIMKKSLSGNRHILGVGSLSVCYNVRNQKKKGD